MSYLPPPPKPSLQHSHSQDEPTCLSIGEYECPSALYSSEFIVGAGVVIFHRKSQRVVLVTDEIDSKSGWFFPKGRKNIGEAVHNAAVREGEEESGFKNKLLPLRIPTRQPPDPDHQGAFSDGHSTEPIYIHLLQLPVTCRWPFGGTYLLHWFISETSDEEVTKFEAQQHAQSRPTLLLRDPSLPSIIRSSSSTSQSALSPEFTKMSTGKGKDSTTRRDSIPVEAQALENIVTSDAVLINSPSAEEYKRDQKALTLKPQSPLPVRKAKAAIDRHELHYRSELFTYDQVRVRISKHDDYMRYLFEIAVVLVDKLDAK